MTQPAILIIERFAEQYRDRLAPAFPQIEIHTAARAEDAGACIAKVDALFSFGPSLDDRLIQRAQRLKWLQFLSSGTDTLARLPSVPSGAIVTSTHGVHGPSVSEMTFLHMLVLARDYARLRRNQDAETWDEFDQVLLYRKTIVIVGTGVIAADLARRCKAFGMIVCGVTRSPRPLENFDRLFLRSDLATAAGQADFLVLLAPLADDTRGMIDGAIFDAMKPSAYLINVGRGAICDEAALIEALRARKIAGAGLDAFCAEPLPKGHALWTLPNVTITPHIAGRSDCYAELVMPILTHNLKCFVEDRVADMVNVKSRAGT